MKLYEYIVTIEVDNRHFTMEQKSIKELIRCKDCKNRPIAGRTEDHNVQFENEYSRCPCNCVDDGWYSWIPDDDFFCGYAERKEE